MRGTADINRRLEEYEKNQLSVYVKRLDALVADLVLNFLPKKNQEQVLIPHHDSVLAEGEYRLSVNANNELEDIINDFGAMLMLKDDDDDDVDYNGQTSSSTTAALGSSSNGVGDNDEGVDFFEEELMGAKVYLDRALLASKKKGKLKIQKLVESFGKVKDSQIAVLDARIRALRKEAKLTVILDEFNYKESKIKEITEYIVKMKKSLLCLGKEVSTQQINAKYKRKCEEEVKKLIGKIDVQNNRIRQLTHENDELKAKILGHKHALTMLIHEIEQAEVAKTKRRFSTATSRSRKQLAHGKIIAPPPEILLTPNSDRFEMMFRDSSDLLTEKHEQLTELLEKGKSIDKTLDALQLEVNSQWSEATDSQQRLQDYKESEEYQVVQRLKLAEAHLKRQMAEDRLRKSKIEAAILTATPGSFVLDSAHGVDIYNALLRRRERRDGERRSKAQQQPIAHGNNKVVHVYRETIVRTVLPHQLDVCDQVFDALQAMTAGVPRGSNIFGNAAASGGSSGGVKTELIKRHGVGGSASSAKNLNDFIAVQSGWSEDDAVFDDFGYTEALTQTVNLIGAITDKSKFDFSTIEALKQGIADLTRTVLRVFAGLNDDKKFADSLEEQKMQALKKQDYIRERFLNAMFGDNRKKISNELAVSIKQIEEVRGRLSKWDEAIDTKRRSVDSLMRVLNAKRADEGRERGAGTTAVPAPAALETILETCFESADDAQDRVAEADIVQAITTAAEESKGDASKVYVAPYVRIARKSDGSKKATPRGAAPAAVTRVGPSAVSRALYSDQLVRYDRESPCTLPTARIEAPAAAAEQRSAYVSRKLEAWRPPRPRRPGPRARSEEGDEEEEEEEDIVVEDLVDTAVVDML